MQTLKHHNHSQTERRHIIKEIIETEVEGDVPITGEDEDVVDHIET